MPPIKKNELKTKEELLALGHILREDIILSLDHLRSHPAIRTATLIKNVWKAFQRGQEKANKLLHFLEL